MIIDEEADQASPAESAYRIASATVDCPRRRRSIPAVIILVISLFLANGAATAAQANETRVQGRWAYMQRGGHNAVEHMATTPSAEDADTWLLVACSADAQLSVALVHATRFQFPIHFTSELKLRSANLLELPVTGKSVQTNLIMIDPAVMRHVMPLLIEENQIGISISETDGSPHDYTFSMKPNDVALAPIRSRCLNVEGRP